MVIVYAIYCEKVDEIYVGMTNNLERRLAEHRRGQSKYTKKFKSIRVIYTEVCKDYKQGRIREKYLKSGVGKEHLKNFKNASIV